MSAMTGWIPRVGTRVTFREDSPQYAKNKGIEYVVTLSPSGEPFSIDRTRNADGSNSYPRTSDFERPFVWLVVADDVDKTPSRQRTRSAFPAALKVVE